MTTTVAKTHHGCQAFQGTDRAEDVPLVGVKTQWDVFMHVC